ncbi:RagB/SusD family nutrient uptake outer membrane protein [Pedobacter ghigonis]|uniref:RagB/SusD family nutrient uptake outer membrane protein n=1 Tax=Pedobacter ghigonis TaxID=2730403 RepID=UPI00158A86CF|nr:RagB/SusD family nutrient uptake outer membrane protein [Pedobacter ghigonis]
MKKITYIIFIAIMSVGALSCKKFLNVTPIDNLSGNNYWQNEADVEKFVNGIYIKLRGRILNNGSTFYTFADLRCAPVINSANIAGFTNLINNDLKGAIASTNGDYYFYNFKAATEWKSYYDVIGSANIMVKEVSEMPGSVISEETRKRYIAEGVFLRNLCYFLLVRMYGDVPYYTNAYNDQPLGRTNQVNVMKNCIADMAAVKDDLPLTYIDASQVGTRAMRGAALALMMHMNMWAAGFDNGIKTSYYEQVVKYGQELSSYADYSLLDYTIDNNKKIFKGNTKESLFEIVSNANYGEVLSQYDNPSIFFSKYPFRGTVTTTTSQMYYSVKFMQKVFPAGNSDVRRSLWFENADLGNNTFQLKKFANTYPSGTNNSISHDDSRIIFRLPDALLLTAEAAANLEDYATAQTFVNKVRARAQATPFSSTGDQLRDDIYYERVRELFCEGQYFYDLVRTKRILDSEYSDHPIGVADFNAGAWTWPISESALANNPNMTLNNFWR